MSSRSLSSEFFSAESLPIVPAAVLLAMSIAGFFSELQIHIDLTGGFGRELSGFQLDQHIGVQNLVVKHHIHIVVGVIHRNALLCADKHESPAKFQQSDQLNLPDSV